MPQNIKTEARRYNHLISEIDAAYHEIALRQGLSDSASMVLYTLADHDGNCLISELVSLTSLSKQTINSALRRLEKDGILYLESAGGRQKRIRLTPKGQVTVKATVQRVIDIENQIYGSWEPEEWALYQALTERFLRELKDAAKEL